MKHIAFITDLHLDEDYPKSIGVNARRNFEEILKDIQHRNIDTVVVGGDIGEESSLEWFFKKMEHFDLKIIPGNHDRASVINKYYKNDLSACNSEMYFTMEDDFNKYVFMDSSAEHVEKSQLSWMQKVINSEKNIIIFIHHPVFAVDTPIDNLYPLQNREAVSAKLFATERPVKIFCGHYHMEDELSLRNITQYISPAISYQVIKEADVIKTTNAFF